MTLKSNDTNLERLRKELKRFSNGTVNIDKIMKSRFRNLMLSELIKKMDEAGDLPPNKRKYLLRLLYKCGKDDTEKQRGRRIIKWEE